MEIIVPSTYPKNYRADAGGGATRALTPADFRRGVATVQMFANQNIKKVANQNFVSISSRKLALRSVAGIAGRLSGWLGLGLAVYDLYQFYEANRSVDVVTHTSTDVMSHPFGYEPQNDVRFYQPILNLNGFEPTSDVWYVYPDATRYEQYYGKRITPAGRLPDAATFAASAYGWYEHITISGNPVTRTYDATRISDPAYPGGFFSEINNLLVHPGYVTLLPGLTSPQNFVVPVPRQNVLSTIDPLVRPYMDGTVPMPVPYRLIPFVGVNPWRYEHYQKNAGYNVGPKLPEKVSDLPLVASTVVISTDPHISEIPVSNAHPRKKRPGKERKVQVSGYAVVPLMINTVTESLDALDAIYDALPKRYKRKHHSEKDKLLVLFEHWDELDCTKAVDNLILNELEDRILGAIGSGYKNASRNLRPHGNLPIGFASGPAL